MGQGKGMVGWFPYPRSRQTRDEVSAFPLPFIMARTAKRITTFRAYPNLSASVGRAVTLAKRVDPSRRVTQADILRDGVECVCTRYERALQRRGESASVKPVDPPALDDAPFTGPPRKPTPRVD